MRSTPLDFLPTPPTPRLVRVLGATVIVSMIVAIGIGQWTWGEMAPPVAALFANVEVGPEPEPVRFQTFDTKNEHIPPRIVTVQTELETRFDVPVFRGVRLDESFPSLRTWTHPVSETPELMPEKISRQFGSHRDGIERAECGEGHCGVDLDGPRGRPIVAVAPGVVVRVELRELGLDGRSGRYVRIEHHDGTLTSYMHMDDVAPVRVGERVTAGQYLGTLGASAVFESAPHLHFALEVPDRPYSGWMGDHTNTHYADPAPFLVRATISPIPQVVPRESPGDRPRGRQREIKPSF